MDGDVLVLFWNTLQMCANAPFIAMEEIEPEFRSKSVPPFASIVNQMYEGIVIGTALWIIAELKGREQ